MLDTLRLSSVRRSVWLRCLWASDDRLGQYSLCPVHTLDPSHWWTASGEVDRSERIWEVRREAGEWKNGERWPQCISIHVTVVMEFSESIVPYTPDISKHGFELFQTHFKCYAHKVATQTWNLPKHTSCMTQVKVWPWEQQRDRAAWLSLN